MKKNIIITAGPTNERIDAVMKITNMSTGALGNIIAETFLEDKDDEIGTIYYVSTKMSYRPRINSEKVQLVTVESTQDVCNNTKKISSYEPHLMTMMQLTPKVISKIKEMAPEVTLVGFKLLEGVSKEELYQVASRLRDKNRADYIVANDLAKIGNGKHWAMILNKDGIITECETKKEIAKALEKLLF